MSLFIRTTCDIPGMESSLASTVVALRHQRPSAVDDDLLGDAMMAAAQNGNSQAYHRLPSQVAIRLRVYYARHLPQAMIDDTVQEVLVAIQLKRHTYYPSRSLARICRLGRSGPAGATPYQGWLGYSFRQSRQRARLERRCRCEIPSNLSDGKAA